VKRRGNRRYYQHHEVLLIRRIRELLYEEGFTISGARNRLDSSSPHDEKAEPAARTRASAAPGAGNVDLGAIKRELRAVLDQLQG
jgi:DNA-binding transcriptional MerR regulator